MHLVRLPRLADVALTGTLVADKSLLELAKIPSMNHVAIVGSGVAISGVDEFLHRKAHRSIVYNAQMIYAEERQNKPETSSSELYVLTL